MTDDEKILALLKAKPELREALLNDYNMIEQVKLAAEERRKHLLSLPLRDALVEMADLGGDIGIDDVLEHLELRGLLDHDV